MRFLHTADWHIGKTLRGRSRMEEYRSALYEILDIAIREKIDCLLCAGDIFDSQAPHAEAEQLVYQFFAELIAHSIPAIVIAGNHDHARRFDALRPILDPMRIQLVPYLKPPAEGGVIEFTTRKETARIALAPWMPEHRLMDAALMMGTQADRSATYAERMADMVEILTNEFTADTVNLVVGHVYVLGAEATGSERAIHLAKPFAIPAQRLPTTASYIALGHIHRPQSIEAPSPTRYCGSLLQLDFGEQGEDKEVVIVDAHPGKTARLESVRLSSGRKLRDVSGTLQEIHGNAVQWNNGDYLRVTVKLDKFKPGVADEVRGLFPEAVAILIELPTAPDIESKPAVRGTPVDLFRDFCGDRAGDEVISAFEKLYAEASDASH
jgi:DNA repair protein SbcD/Mre11